MATLTTDSTSDMVRLCFIGLYSTVIAGIINHMARPRTRFIDVGTRYGRTTVVEELDGFKPRRLRMICDCGREHQSRFGDVWRGQVTSCGCLQQENLRRGLHGTHGLRDRPEYYVW